MSLTESAVLLGLHPVRMSLFVLGHVVITLLTFCTCQCDFCTHNFHLHVLFLFLGLFLFLRIKKRPIASIRPSTISQIFPAVNRFACYSKTFLMAAGALTDRRGDSSGGTDAFLLRPGGDHRHAPRNAPVSSHPIRLISSFSRAINSSSNIWSKQGSRSSSLFAVNSPDAVLTVTGY